MAKKKSTKIDTPKKDITMSLKKRALLDQLEKTLGVVTTACKAVGVSRSSHYNWMDPTHETYDPEYRKAVEGLKDVALDFAESQLHQQIKDGSTAATIFYLKTQGKKRGFIERIETDNLNPMEPIEVHIIDPAADQDENQSE